MPPLQEFWSRLAPRLEIWWEKTQRISSFLGERLGAAKEKSSDRLQQLGDRFSDAKSSLSHSALADTLREKEERLAAGLRQKADKAAQALHKVSDKVQTMEVPGARSALMESLQEKEARVSKDLRERWAAFADRVNALGAAKWEKFSATSREMVEGVARGEDAWESRLERTHPQLAKALHTCSNPLRWMRQSSANGLAVAIVLFALTAGVIALRVGMSLGRSHAAYVNDKVLLYDLDDRCLRAYPPGTLPGTGHTAGLMLYTTPGGPQPETGMTLDELQRAGLVVGWLFRTETGTWQGQYATPENPDEWVDASSKDFQKWMNQCQRDAQDRAGDKILVPCATRIGDLKKAGK